MNARSRWPAVLVGVLLILLPLLAALQYRWIGQVSSAERDRLENSLRISSDRVANDFVSEISDAATGIQIQNGFPDTAGPIIERYRDWEATAAHPQIIRHIYIIKQMPDAAHLYNVDFDTDSLKEIEWPKGWESFTRLGFGPPAMPGAEEFIGAVTPLTGGPPIEPFAGGPAQFGPSRRGIPGGRPGPPQGVRPAGWCIIEFDRDVLFKELVPELVEMHFGAHDSSEYRVGLISPGNPTAILYSSAGSWTPMDIASADATLDLIPSRNRRPGPPPRDGNNPPPPRGQFQENLGSRGPGGPRGRGGRGSPAARPPVTLLGRELQLVVKHRLGSVESAANGVRTRNLALSFGILLVLGAGAITVLISGLRARALGKLQMDFAAGVSHELRTPLAVIQSAAYNLGSGVVTDRAGVQEYAAIVQDETRRLSDMVDQVLLYAETQSRDRKFDLVPVEISAVIDRAIHNISHALRQVKGETISEIEPGLPPALADAAALTQCLQNLLNNAVKYGASNGRPVIRVSAALDTSHREIQIRVEDQGPGIQPEDRAHLFEPFYRGTGVSSNIPGNGLGLHLVKRLMESQQGRVTFVNSDNSKGACFILHVRVAEERKRV